MMVRLCAILVFFALPLHAGLVTVVIAQETGTTPVEAGAAFALPAVGELSDDELAEMRIGQDQETLPGIAQTDAPELPAPSAATRGLLGTTNSRAGVYKLGTQPLHSVSIGGTALP